MECNHNMNFYTQTISTGSKWIRKQCSKCGFLDAKVYKQKEVTDVSKLYEYSIEDWNKYRRIKSFEKQLRYNIKLNEYIEYLSSDKWKEIRKQIIYKYNGICDYCHNEGNDVHHLTYDNFRNEPLDDLVLLCRKCHEQEHIDKPNLRYVK